MASLNAKATISSFLKKGFVKSNSIIGNMNFGMKIN